MAVKLADLIQRMVQHRLRRDIPQPGRRIFKKMCVRDLDEERFTDHRYALLSWFGASVCLTTGSSSCDHVRAASVRATALELGGCDAGYPPLPATSVAQLTHNLGDGCAVTLRSSRRM